MLVKTVKSAAPLIPPGRRLSAVAEASKACRACPLWRDATQTVFGEGPVHAPLVLIGETPGDQEDKQGHVFVGPAGGVLDKALAMAGLRRRDLYLTNAVKHFKFHRSGKKRIHDRPTRGEATACKPWVMREIELVAPQALLVMGATAAMSLLGSKVSVMKDHGQLLPSPLAPIVVVTIHPAAVLRGIDSEARHRMMEQLVADLRVVVTAMHAHSSAAAL